VSDLGKGAGREAEAVTGSRPLRPPGSPGAPQYRLKSVSITNGVAEWQERSHDDLVLAVADAPWQAERPSGLFVAVIPRDPPVRVRPR
jgi:hypothetical protein